MDDNQKIQKILSETRTIAVVGLSPKPERHSHDVAEYLQRQGYKIIPVYPREDTILGEKVYRSLKDLPDKVDTVLIFRKPGEVAAVVDEAILIKPKFIWMQEGIVDKKSSQKAEGYGIITVMDRCMYKEHLNLY
jgi:predicted CoA-binding protein